MRKSLILSALLTFVLVGCATPPDRVVIGGGPGITPTPVMPVPAQPAPTSGPQVTTTTGVRVVFGADSTVITNYSDTTTPICVNAECANLPAGYTATADSGAAAITKLSAYGAELTFNPGGSYMRPVGGQQITTRRISIHSGAPLLISDNIPAAGEAWTDRVGDIKQLVIEYLN